MIKGGLTEIKLKETGEKLLNKKLHNFYYSSYIIRLIKARRMRGEDM